MGHSSVNETRCTIVFCFAVAINHLTVSLGKVVLFIALLLEHQASAHITACLSKSKALSKHFLDFLSLLREY